eukprot:scaffold228751_cov31-Tisochrysis_lutea.AAC.2
MCKFRMKARDLHRLSGKLVNVRNCCFSDARPHASSTHGRFTMPVTLNRMQHCRCASSSNSSSASLLHSESLVLHFQMIFLTTNDVASVREQTEFETARGAAPTNH